VSPTVLIDNFLDVGNGTIFTADLVQADFSNCIIYGNNGIELLFNQAENDSSILLEYSFKNCLIKFDDFNNRFVNDPLYNFNDTDIFENIVFNSDPDFKNTDTGEFIIGDNSGAIGIGNTPNTPPEIQFDILGFARTMMSDVGAYNHTTFDDD
jgi:hypothetical protein